VLFRSAGAVVETNPAFKAIANTGGNPAALPFPDLFSAADRDEVSARLDAARAGEYAEAPLEVIIAKAAPNAQTAQTAQTTFGADPRTVQIYARRTDGGEDGAVPDLIVYIVDITDLKNLETQIAQSQKMQAVGQLAGGIAHDFNNLLTAMIGFRDLLLQRHSPGDQSFGDIMQIKQNANRAANLVRQLLAFSRRQTLQPKVLNLTDVLAELSHLLRRLIGENIELEIIHARDVGLVRVDQGQLEQVVINLAVNARDAMPDGGVLTIQSANVSFAEPTRMQQETLPAGDFVVIEVRDAGCGISANILDKIFEPFFTTKEVGAGTGLGLSTVYGII
jgi:two-component system cell cycle sensor histidine kinase/response regulator CckA